MPLDILPSLATFNGADIGFGGVEYFSDASQVDSGANHASNLPDLGFGKLAVSIISSVASLSEHITTLRDHILGVVHGGSEKHVRRSDALSIIAFMASVKSVWNWSVLENPTQPVSANASAVSILGRNVKTSVTGVVLSTVPNPASGSDGYEGPESDDILPRKSLRLQERAPIVRPLDQVHFDWVTLPKVTGLAGATCLNGIMEG